jgi:hypothetical protein
MQGVNGRHAHTLKAVAQPTLGVKVKRVFGSFLWLCCATASAQVDLTVVDGYGSGVFASGTSRIVAARTPQPNEVFSHWRVDGDTAVVPDWRQWLQFATVPASATTLRAQFKPFGAVTLEALSVNGSQARYAVPPGGVPAHTLLLRFHGSGGSAQGQFSPGENQFFSELALARGFAVASLNSVDRSTRQWNPSFALSNPDVQNVDALIAELRSRGVIGKSAPVVGQGTSNGGGFVTRVSALLGFQAQAVVIAAGINVIVQNARIPTFWVLNRNDTVVGPQALESATASAAVLTAQGIRNRIAVLEPTPIYPERFTRVRNLSIANSRAVYDALRARNALDAYDFLIVHPSTLSDLQLPPPANLYSNQIASQIAAAWAEHEFTSNFMHLQFDFLGGVIFADGFD